MSYEASCALTLVILALCAWSWVRAYKVGRAHPERFRKPRAVWQIANEMAKNRHRPPAHSVSDNGQPRSQRLPSFYPISFW